jgi:hypothetical protein
MTMWTCKLAMTPNEVQLLIQSDKIGDLLKARLTAEAGHPRALITLLEEVALWSGGLLGAAISADESVQIGCALGVFGDEPWQAESPLVRFEPAARANPKALRGMGDFRALRRGRRAAEDHHHGSLA